MSANTSRRPGEEPRDEARGAAVDVERRSRTGRGAARIPRRIGLAAVAVSVMTAGSALAFQPLPPGAQVNDDLAAGINKNISVSGEDPTNADVVGGSLVASNPAVPWAVFRQRETNGSVPPHDQVFSRSFAAGAWTTRGSGTVGGRSSASPQFPGSLNFDQGEDAEAPEIDFAGAGRTVPWATWYEDTTGTGFGNNNVFASRFDVTQNKWIFAGQNRGTGGGSVMVPSLNIHTDQDAENPSVAGGSAVDPTKPGPWVTWQETTTLPTNDRDQIFVERPIGPGTTNCDGVQPAGVAVAGHVPAIGGFCWQQTGIPRVGPGHADPSLNVDPTRNGVEPDIAFTGANDSVPWVVWYEKDNTSISTLQDNEMVFAAKGVPDGVAGNGGFHWIAVGNQLSGTLDTSGAHGFGACAESATSEQQCALNHDPTADAEDPRVAAGTMTAGTATVPWVVWDESVSGLDRIFVSRLVGTGATAHFEIVNRGAPLATFTHGDTRPDITFSANTPYVTWRADFLGRTRGFVGHFVNPSNPTFVFDELNVPLAPTSLADVREPISSNCTANPFNADGTACQGGPVPAPFFLFTRATNILRLFAGAVTTGAFDPTAKLLGHGRNVRASGPGVVCKPGERVLLTVRIKQGRSTALGVWRKHGCNNNPPQWHIVLSITKGKRLHPGPATGQGSARITRHGHVVRIVRWTRGIVLTR